MRTNLTSCVAILAVLCAATAAHAGSCANAISRVQAKVDAAIDAQAGSGGWKPESLRATRSYQPTPRSIAAAEAGQGPDFASALDALTRARAADSTGDMRTCRRELAKTQAVLRSQGR